MIFDLQYPKVNFLYPLIAIIFAINYFRYERNFDFDRLEKRWGEMPISKRKKHWMILIAYLTMTFTLPWIYGFSK